MKNLAAAVVCLLMIVGSTQTANAQYAVKYNTDQPVTVGDTIQIDKTTQTYLTGEKIPTWVYNANYVVQQVGTKRFPQGVLLKGIFSWVQSQSLIPIAIAAPPVEDKDSVEESAVEPVEQLTTDSLEQQNQLVVDTVPAAIEDSLLVDSLQGIDITSSAISSELEFATAESYEIPTSKEYERFSIGLRSGIASTFVGGFPLGFDALFDMQYAHYWAKRQVSSRYGILTGLSAGYMQVRQTANVDDTFNDADINYHVLANVDENLAQVIIEVPLMFSMITLDGFYLNVGPKFILPVFSQAKQTITNDAISAYLPELNGHPIINEVVTGMLTEEQKNLNTQTNNQFSIVLSVGLDLGYEFTFKNGNSLDLGVFASYMLYNTQKNAVDAKIISVKAPTTTGCAEVTVQPLSNVLSKHIGHFDAGVKLSYNFDFIKK